MSVARGTEPREQLAAGARRGLGWAGEVAEAALRDGTVLRALVAALDDDRPVVVARAANALKKVQAAEPRALDRFAGQLLRVLETCTVAEARWNLLLALSRLRLGKAQRAHALELLLSAQTGVSTLERVHALDALVHISEGDGALQVRVRSILQRGSEDRSAAVRARTRRLLRTFAGAGGRRGEASCG